MKTIIILTLAAALTAGTFQAHAQSDDPLARLRQLRAQAQQQLGVPPADDTSADANAAPTPADAAPTPEPPAAPEPAVEYTGVPVTWPTNGGGGTNGINLNFRNAPLDLVLNYLSDAAGFIIILDTPVHGTVSVISSHPMTKDEAVDLLNSVLNKNGFAAIRNDRTLTIVDKNDAKTRDIPVKTSNDPDSIPNNAEIVTQIIPIRFVEARQLVSDLSSFVSPQATIVANEEGNSIVITDTQSNIRHLVEIIKAVDSSAEAETEIRVFHLKYANPTDVATLLGGIFPSSSGSGTQAPIRFGGGGGPGGGGGGPGGFFARMMAAQGGGQGAAQSGGGQNQRVQKAQQVIAVADLRTSSVVVTAAKDLMEEIDGMIRDLDVNSSRDQKVYVFHVDNADPQQAVQVLQTMFQNSSSSRSSSSSSSTQNSALMNREQQNNTTTGSSSSTTSGGSGIGGAGGRSGGGGGGLF
jgi:type II secretory pathway component GspD/PulD (secretin)